ncbi:hypothetical protein TNCV_1667281 [Trichonephila clavipes]|nr:hypothetical protein TNCV_1667281 [Trichonephila clavipes]
MFSDESRFCLGASDGNVLVRRRPGERLQLNRPKHTGPTLGVKLTELSCNLIFSRQIWKWDLKLIARCGMGRDGTGILNYCIVSGSGQAFTFFGEFMSLKAAPFTFHSRRTKRKASADLLLEQTCSLSWKTKMVETPNETMELKNLHQFLC